jgi:ATP-dependent DNA helicase RecQ
VCLSTVELFDATALATKVLSAVTRLGERFGAGYVIEFLRGSKSAKILSWHPTLETSGTGADVSRDAWNQIIRELVERDYLMRSEDVHPVLKITATGKAVLEGTHNVMLTRRKEGSSEWAEVQGTKIPYETALYEELKVIRRQLAAGENLAAYIVLSDATLIELATYLPQNLDELRRISGFGEMKLEKYGAEFLDGIRSYCRKRSLPSKIEMKATKKTRPNQSSRPERDNETKQESLSLFQKGNSIEQIAALRKLSSGTVEGHLAFYVQQGKLSLDEVVDVDRVPLIRQAIEQVGGKMLTPIKQFLGENYSYNEIRYVLADMEYAERRKQKVES